ncbi:hypothetical protein BV20DRAFT_965047 [Pilatotrama ljubarskyi]|nr:hypothetical protein BV20DRAFT_965047 [Pilatotrama ljubarskyi]
MSPYHGISVKEIDHWGGGGASALRQKSASRALAIRPTTSVRPWLRGGGSARQRRPGCRRQRLKR